MNQEARPARAFTLVEVMVVVVLLGILAAVAVPAVGAARQDARSQSAEAAVLGVRAAIAAHRQRAVIAGEAPFPTLAELTATGTVTRRPIPPNPYTGVSGVRAASAVEAGARAVVSPATHGWAYHVDNAASPPVAVFYANSADATGRTDPADGTTLGANEL